MGPGLGPPGELFGVPGAGDEFVPEDDEVEVVGVFPTEVLAGELLCSALLFLSTTVPTTPVP